MCWFVAASFVLMALLVRTVLFPAAGPHRVTAAEQRIANAGLETTGVDDTVCCFAHKTETWVEGPDNKWEWYVKTGDAEQLENEVMAKAEVTGCCT